MRAPKPRSDGLRVTKVGLWFLLFLFIILVAATNTGNNGLFLVLAVMGAAVVVSHFLAKLNVQGLGIDLRPPAEIFANSPFRIEVRVTNRSRWLPKWLLILKIDPKDVEPIGHRGFHQAAIRAAPLLVPRLGRRRHTGHGIELLMRRRGRHRLSGAHVSSLFPLGFFRKGMRYPLDLEVLVLPEIFSSSGRWPARAGRTGDEPTRRVGWGHDLQGLRPYRHGDDPRSIHWKQSARTGSLVFKERESEENRQLLIVFDNAVGELADAADHQRFERLVSEAATAGLDYLAAGFEVALLTRDASVPFASGTRQRHNVLETLALIEARPEEARPLSVPGPEVPHMRLAMERRHDRRGGGRSAAEVEVEAEVA